jgi:glycosyltransferase involved in cell wall biosynthesis
MAAGLPLLSSLPGELERLISQHRIGFCYEAGNADCLTRQILWLHDHPEERDDMGRRAWMLFNERFRSGAIYPRLARHLEEAVRLHRQSPLYIKDKSC